MEIEATGVKLAWSKSGMMCSHTEAQTQTFLFRPSQPLLLNVLQYNKSTFKTFPGLKELNHHLTISDWKAFLSLYFLSMLLHPVNKR
jgi:hypothetical protein